MIGINDSIKTTYVRVYSHDRRVDFSWISVTREGLDMLVDCVSSLCALCDTYKPIKEKCAVFE